MVQGPTYQYFDLLESVASPVGDRARIYWKNDKTGTDFYDEIDGSGAGVTVMPDPSDWYHVSSPKGSFFVTHGREQDGRLDPTQSKAGAYSDTTSPIWTLNWPAEYEKEPGDRGAFRTEYPGVVGGDEGSQKLDECVDPYGDGITVILEKHFVMLNSGRTDNGEGEAEAINRGRGVLSQCVVEQEYGTVPGPATPCTPTLTSTYNHDGGVVNLSANGCASARGWNLYHELGGGVRRRLATLGPGAEYRDVNLDLNESRTYSARALDEDCEEGGASTPVTVLHDNIVAPDPPDDLGAIVVGQTIDVSWGVPAAPDVAGYRVLAASTQGGPYTQVHTGTLSAMVQNQLFQVVTPGTYYVIVHSVDEANNESLPSQELSVVVP